MITHRGADHTSDTPQKDQPWGPEAKAVLAARFDRRAVALEVVAVRRFKPKNVYNLTLVAYLEREFRAAWDDPLRRTRRVFELHS